MAQANLAQHAAQAAGAYAPNTERALRADVAIFSAWCADQGLEPLPASPDTVVAFVDTMAATKAPATIRRYVSSIAALHRAAGMENPALHREVGLALKRMHRAKGRAQAQATGLTRSLVERMLEAPGAGPRSLRNRALLAVAYDTLCRRSELIALDYGDLEHGTAGDATVIVRRSKSDQEGAGMVRYLAPDTVRALRAWMTAAGITQGRLFRAVSKSGQIGGALDAGDVARVFKAMAKAAGIPAETVARISGHSSRVGAAQDMAGSGIELPAIMSSGGWRTPEMISRYTKRLDARRSGAAKLAMMQNRA